MANLSNINNILRTDSLGVGINRDPLGVLEVSSATRSGIKMFNTGSSGRTYETYVDASGNYIIYDEDASRNDLVINSSGNATFIGTIYASNNNPAYSFASDTATGIARTGTHQMAFVHPSYTSLTLDALGRATFPQQVGIGAAPLQGKLDILNNGDYDAHTGHGLTINSNASNAYTSMYMGADDSIDATYIQSAGRNTSFTSKKLLLNPNGGNVGIGTSSPGEKLDVNGDIRSNRRYLIATGTANQNMAIGYWDGSNARIEAGSALPMLITSYQGNIKLGISGGTTMTIQSSKVAIGTTIMNGKLSVAADDGTSTPPLSSGIYVGPYQGNTAVGSAWSYSNSAATYTDFSSRYNSSDSNMRFIMKASATPVYAMTIKGDGRVGIGTTSPQGKLDVAADSSTASAIKTLVLGGGTGVNGNGQYIQFRSSSNVTLGSQIAGTRVAAGAASDLRFSTTDSSSVVSERMRITSAGAIEVRNGSTVGGEIKLSGADNDLTLNGARDQIIFQINGTPEYVMDANQFYPESDNVISLGLSGSRFSTVYAANGVNTSDETLKENIKECDLGIDFIDSLKPKSYNLKDLKEDNDAYGKKRYGLIAQDILQTELKDSVFGKKDGEYGLSYNDLIAPMIKAIQELKAEIEILKNK
jgi:hypothetical protein